MRWEEKETLEEESKFPFSLLPSHLPSLSAPHGAQTQLEQILQVPGWIKRWQAHTICSSQFRKRLSFQHKLSGVLLPVCLSKQHFVCS